MAIQIVQKQKPADPLDKLVNAVAVAKAIYGIHTDQKTLSMLEQQKAEQTKLTGLQAKTLEDQQKGIITPKDLLTAGVSDYSDTAKPGYVPVLLQNTADDSGPLQKFVKPKSAENPLTDLIKGLDLTNKQLDVKKKEKDMAEGKAPTADQSKAALFATRMGQAETVLGDLEANGNTGTDASSAFQRSGMFPEMLKSENMKKRQQAEGNFLNAVLRRESGAAISPSEFESGAAQYFNRIGDTPEVLAQKADNRKLAIAGIASEAGPNALKGIDKQLGVSSDHNIPDDRVTVVAPNGQLGHIPKSQLKDAISSGYKVK